MRFAFAVAMLALACGGETEPENVEAPLCAWEEPLGDECARFTGAQFGLEGRSCEPVSCLVVPFGDNDGTVQQVTISPPELDAVEMETGSCAELTCP